MWRAFLMAIGISAIILGGEFMIVDRMVIAAPQSAITRSRDISSPTLSTFGSSSLQSRKIFIPPEWAPWGLLSGGVLVVLYAASLAHRE